MNLVFIRAKIYGFFSTDKHEVYPYEGDCHVTRYKQPAPSDDGVMNVMNAAEGCN
jgi:hypothetical protein